MILALPRGGVPVGFEVAKFFHTMLDTVVARKIGMPENPELGVGAIAPGDVIVFDEGAMKFLGYRKKDFEKVAREEMEEMDRRIVRYQSGEYSMNIVPKTVIVVDDGIATGVTARAAVASVKITQNPEKIIFATPVCARESADVVRGAVDEFVCLHEVEHLMSVGEWYDDFPQTTDDDVIALLETSKERFCLEEDERREE